MRRDDVILGAIQVFCNSFFWKFHTHPSPLINKNNVEKYSFIMLVVLKFDTPNPYCVT